MGKTLGRPVLGPLRGLAGVWMESGSAADGPEGHHPQSGGAEEQNGCKEQFDKGKKEHGSEQQSEEKSCRSHNRKREWLEDTILRECQIRAFVLPGAGFPQ